MLSHLPTILATILANAQLLTFLSIFLALETFFINIKPIFNLNNRLLSRKLLKIVFFNIQQKQYTMGRRKVSNLYKVVIDYSLSNIGSILANSSFGNICFTSNEDDWENSTLGIIHKSNN